MVLNERAWERQNVRKEDNLEQDVMLPEWIVEWITYTEETSES